jgi:hypothetical protein
LCNVSNAKHFFILPANHFLEPAFFVPLSPFFNVLSA